MMASRSFGTGTAPPVVLAVSGLDPTGSAGLIADIRVLASLGYHPCGVVTCETVQSSHGLSAVHSADPEIFEAQIRKVLEDIPVASIKIGVLASVEIIEILGRELSKWPAIPIVLDPVFSPTTGPAFLDTDGMRAMSEHLLKLIYIATPNLRELGQPAGIEVGPEDDEMILGCASGWIDAGVRSVLVTGIRRKGRMIDRLIKAGAGTDDALDVLDFEHAYIDAGNVHGTGCVLSSAIAGYVAKGEGLGDAVRHATEYVSRAISSARKIGGGAAFWVSGDNSPGH